MSTHSIEKWFLLALAIAGSSIASAHGSEVSSQESQPPPIRALLSVSSGDEYMQARKEALKLPNAQFQELLASLREGDAASSGRIVAAALQLRKTNEAVAQEFDTRVQAATDHPETATRSGRPKYSAWWPLDRPELDPLAFELILKRSAVEPLRQAYAMVADRPNPSNIDRILALAQIEGSMWCGRLLRTAEGNAAEQARITPVLVSTYKHWRERGELEAGCFHVLASFGTSAQLDALKEIRDFERAQCGREGLTPWSDLGAKPEWAKANLACADAISRLEGARKAGESPRELAKLERDAEQLKSSSKVLARRMQAQVVWEQLEEKIAELSRTLSNTGATRR